MIVAVEAVVTVKDVSRRAYGLTGRRPVERERLEVDEPLALLEPGRNNRSRKREDRRGRPRLQPTLVRDQLDLHVHGICQLRMRGPE